MTTRYIYCKYMQIMQVLNEYQVLVRKINRKFKYEFNLEGQEGKINNYSLTMANLTLFLNLHVDSFSRRKLLVTCYQ